MLPEGIREIGDKIQLSLKLDIGQVKSSFTYPEERAFVPVAEKYECMHIM
jgi:hypothetical protein